MSSAAQRNRLHRDPPRRHRPAARVFPPTVRRVVVWLAAAILAFVLAPYLIAPFYRIIDPVSMPMLYRWATGARVVRQFVPLPAIAPMLARTVIVAEDASFCRNHGIDLGAIREALQQSDDDIAESRGASTITQQVAKNLFLWPGHSIVRKVLEIPLALWLNLVLPKRRVIEIYLNIAEWGPGGQFGAEAGARYAFGIPARNLTDAQAAELAAILPNPSRRSARNPGLIVRRLAELYERRALARPALAGCLTPARLGSARIGH